MGRAPCCDKANVKRGPWSPEEDATLKRYFETHGTGGNWIALPKKAGLKRCGKSCRLRWLNYLRPDIKHGGFTEEEDKIIFTLYSQMGSRWSLITSHLPGRTDNDVKNYWNTKLKKKLLLGGKTSLAIKNNTEIIAPSDNSNSTAPSFTPSLPCVFPKTETNSSLTFWDSLTQSSVTLPISSDAGYDQHLLNTAQSLSLDPVDQFSYTAGVMDNVSELGSNLINNHNIVSCSQEGSGISDSSSISMDHNNKCLSMTDGVLMDSGFGYHYDPATALLFEDNAGEVASTCCPNLAGFGYADIKDQQGYNQNAINQY